MCQLRPARGGKATGAAVLGGAASHFLPASLTGRPDPGDPRRADALRNRERILAAAERLLRQSPSATLADIAAAAGTSRSTVYRNFGDRGRLIAAIAERPQSPHPDEIESPIPPGQLGRRRPVVLDAIQVFDVVSAAQLPQQLVAEAQRIAGVPVALYVLDIDGTHLLRIAGPQRLPDQIEAPLAVGPEIDADGLHDLRSYMERYPGTHTFPL